VAVMDQLLRIKAAVSGQDQVTRLGQALGGVSQTAATVTGSIKGLTAAAGMGGLAGAMGALAPLLSVAGLVGMAKGALAGGDAMYELSQKTGVTVESLARFKKAASTAGTDIETVAKASMKLSKGLFEAQGGSGPVANALKNLGISATDASGKLRSADDVMLAVATRFRDMPDGVNKTALAMQLFGKSGADLIPMLNQGGDAIDKMKVKMTTAFAENADEYSDKLTALGGKVGALGMDIVVALLPALLKITDAMTAVVDVFNNVPAPIRGLIVVIALLAVSWSPLIAVLTTVVGGLAALTAAVPGAIAALTALLSFLTGSLAPAALAVFTGPAGWTVLAIAAVVAMAIAFREPLLKFLSWFADSFIGFIQNAWTNLTSALPRAMQSVANIVRNVFRGVLQFIANGINSVVNLINGLIGAYNRLPAPDLPFVPTVSVPAFAAGGVVSRPTLAMVGEGGEREYVIPESKMHAAAARFLAGGRGASVIPSASGGSPGSSAGPRISITTGPVMQQPDGSRWVSLDDYQRGMRQLSDQLLGQLRRPEARMALGWRR
jgi:hypothetical protein